MSDNAGQNEQRSSANQGGQTPEIDLKVLAEKVYRLMLADIRLTQARGSQQGNRRKRSS